MVAWLRLHSSVVVVVVLTALWTATELVAPTAIEAALHAPWQEHPTIGEGPVEWLQIAVLVCGGFAWAAVAAKMGSAGRRLPALLALGMVLQLGFVSGEELKWGYRLDWSRLLGLGEWCPQAATLRNALRYGGILPETLTGPVVGAYLLHYLAAPFARFGAMERFRARAAPVAATMPEAWAFVAIPVCWVGAGLLIGAFPDDELLQLGLYAVGGLSAVRILRQSGGSAS